MIDAYKIQVAIALSSNAPQVLGIMSKDLLGLNKNVDLLEQGFTRAKVVALGLAGVLGGGGALGIMTKLVEKGIEFNQQLVQMKMANYSGADIDTLKNQAFKTMIDVPGSNILDNVNMLADLRNISGATEHATALADAMTRVNLVLANISGQSPGDAGYKFAKFLEDSGRMMDPKTGQFSDARVETESRWMQAVIAAMNGRITGSELFQLRQSGKASVNTLSDEGLTNLLPAIQSLGPVAVGTALQGAQQQLLGAVQLRKQTVEWLERYGLIDPTKAHQGKGGYFALDPGALKNESGLMHDLPDWIWGTVESQMKAKGLTREQMVDEIKRSGLRTPMLGLMAELIQNEWSQKKEIGNVHRAEGVNQYDVMNQESPTFRITKFKEAWDNLVQSLGMPSVDDATKMLNRMSSAMESLTKFAVAHPELVKQVEMEAAILATFAVTLGTFAIGMAAATALGVLAGPAGLLMATVAGVTALTAAFKDLDEWLRAIGLVGGAVLDKQDKALRDQGGARVPWWWPLPTGPGGREPTPDLNFNHYLPGGGGAQKQSYLPPSGSNRPIVQTIVYTQLDGRTIAKTVSTEMARFGDLPPAGRTGFDGKMTPIYPSSVGA